jgi:hypothetical protein
VVPFFVRVVRTCCPIGIACMLDAGCRVLCRRRFVICIDQGRLRVGPPVYGLQGGGPSVLRQVVVRQTETGSDHSVATLTRGSSRSCQATLACWFGPTPVRSNGAEAPAEGARWPGHPVPPAHFLGLGQESSAQKSYLWGRADYRRRRRTIRTKLQGIAPGHSSGFYWCSHPFGQARHRRKVGRSKGIPLGGIQSDHRCGVRSQR